MHPFSSLINFLYSDYSEKEAKCLLAHDLIAFKSNIYDASCFGSNEGGMGLEGAFFTYKILLKLCPDVIFESGVWKGFSTYLLDQIASIKRIYSFDPAVAYPNFIQYKSCKAEYFSVDWASPMFAAFTGSLPVAFFDDHQDQFERLMVAYCRGIKYVLFDDNYFFGGGGHAGLANYMNNAANILSMIVKYIYIAPPLVFQGKGIDPVFAPTDGALPSDLLRAVQAENNYNWLTLVELNSPSVPGLSQIPDQEYILSAYSHRPL